MNETFGWIAFFISALLSLFGMAAFLLSAAGVFRFRHVMYRMHATAIADTVGVLCFTLSAAVYLGFSFTAAKELAVAVMMLFTSPVQTHLLAEIEYRMGEFRRAVKGKGGGSCDV